MRLNIEKTEIPEVIEITPKVYKDARGFFMETYNQELYSTAGISCMFVQDNYSYSTHGTLRGLHYQLPHTQGKLISVIKGRIFDVVVDVRKGSPTFGKWVGRILSDENKKQLFISEGFAHGFCVLSEDANVMYKCTDFYSSVSEKGILWSDKQIGIDWPITTSVISTKDSKLPLLVDIPPEDLPVFYS